MGSPTTATTARTLSLSNTDRPYARYYPNNWPAIPFHEGEITMQRKFGDHEAVMQYAPRIIRPYMPDQHRDFYRNQPFIVAAARDDAGDMWATILQTANSDASMISSPDPITLQVDALPLPGDALEGAFQEGTDVGFLGIEFATKRRNRVNGLVKARSSNGFTFDVAQSFGNCPQYIQPRKWWMDIPTLLNKDRPNAIRSKTLSAKQIALIQSAQTMFIATGYRGEGNDVRFGNDASHRGGSGGFVRVDSPTLLQLPDYAGNKAYNSIGNIYMDSRIGLTFVDFENGGMVQITGRAALEENPDRIREFAGALRLVTIQVTGVNELPPGSLPLRWITPRTAAPREVSVAEIVRESEDVKSFYLKPQSSQDPPLWDFQPGNHVPVTLRTPNGELLRTYSLSSSALDKNQYRISIKRHSNGGASRFLHDEVKVGDRITLRPPAGDFVLENKGDNSPIVLVSAGVGVTPMLSMLHTLVGQGEAKHEIIWIHGARDGNHHPFRDEVKELLRKSEGASIKSVVLYSKPGLADAGLYDLTGRISMQTIRNSVERYKDANYYMCGPVSFMGELQSDLEANGVGANQIHFETF